MNIKPFAIAAGAAVGVAGTAFIIKEILDDDNASTSSNEPAPNGSNGSNTPTETLPTGGTGPGFVDPVLVDPPIAPPPPPAFEPSSPPTTVAGSTPAIELDAPTPSVDAGSATGSGGNSLTDQDFISTGPKGMGVAYESYVHNVQSGDTLSQIARAYNARFGLNLTFRDIYNDNSETIGPDINRLMPGQMLFLPALDERLPALAQVPGLVAHQGSLAHQVRSGDTLSAIARQYSPVVGRNLTWQNIFDANRGTISNPNMIVVGQKLHIPGLSDPIPAAPSAPKPPAPPAPKPPAPPTPPSVPAEVAALNGQTVLQNLAEVRHENGATEVLPVASYSWIGSTARSLGTTSLWDAHAAAYSYARSQPEYTVVGTTQAADGVYWMAHLSGREESDNLDHTDTYLSRWWAPASDRLATFATQGYADVFQQG